jgi:predicted DsbA family dithiol-disulfide isomerase
VRWLPFQLNPDLPPTGMPRREYIEHKWGPGRGPEVYARVAGVGSSVGIPFAFENIAVQPNTLEAHRLLTYAEQQGRQDEVAEVLFKAYFIDGANLADQDTLADIGARGGLDREAVRTYLDSDQDREQVAQADIEARTAGVGGVPFFIFNRRVGVSGAQDEDTLLRAMEQASKSEG